LAKIRARWCERLATDPPVLLRQKIHREMNAGEVAAGDGQIARLFGSARQHHRVVELQQVLRRKIDAHMDAVAKHHAFRLHLLQAAIDMGLFHLEIGNAVAQQAAGTRVLFKDMYVMPCARQLLGARQAGGTRADHRNRLAGARLGDLRHDPAFIPATIHDGAFDGLDGDRAVAEVERAGRFARRRADAAGELREIIGGVEVACRPPPSRR
jgi:hypothetical protein